MLSVVGSTLYSITIMNCSLAAFKSQSDSKVSQESIATIGSFDLNGCTSGFRYSFSKYIHNETLLKNQSRRETTRPISNRLPQPND